jgi:hypothetical protein
VTPRFRISYVDGTTAEGAAEDWAEARSDGVNAVEFDRVGFQGHSLYWVRRVAGGWAAGAASFYRNPVFELTVVDGKQENVEIEHVPDLRHAEVKLGWWWIDG